jgi:Sulfotransferase family
VLVGSADLLFHKICMAMTYLNERSPLLFIHITKTAGGSFQQLLENSLGNRSIFYNVPAPLPTVEVHHQLIFGHFPFGLHELLQLPPRYGCVVRHPIARVVSHYYHLYDHEPGDIGEQIRNSGKDINDFFATSYHWEFENFVCKILSGKQGVDAPRGVDHIAALYQSTRDNLRQHFAYVGVFEYIQLSILNLSTVLNTDLTLLPRVNAGTYDWSAISSQTLQRISQLNYYDILLYNEIVQQFLQHSTVLASADRV